MASPPANKPTSSGATKTLRSIGKGKSMRFAVTGQGGEGVEGAAVPKEQSTADCVQTTQAAAATGPAPAPAPDEPAARPSARAAPAPAAGSSLGGTSLELSKSLASHLGVPVPGDAGDADGENSVAAVPVVAQETVYDLNGLPFRNLNKVGTPPPSPPLLHVPQHWHCHHVPRPLSLRDVATYISKSRLAIPGRVAHGHHCCNDDIATLMKVCFGCTSR